MYRAFCLAALLAAAASAGGCQSYGSRPYDVKLNSPDRDAHLYLVPNSEWVQHDEGSIYQATTRGWLDAFELKQMNRPVVTKLLGHQHVFVVINKRDNRVYLQKFNPMSEQDLRLPDDRVR